jgi:GAF domain-containing protein
VPLFDDSSEVIAVLDVDSDRISDFSDVDREGLEKIAAIAANCFSA